jgi:hypothetical protein
MTIRGFVSHLLLSWLVLCLLLSSYRHNERADGWLLCLSGRSRLVGEQAGLLRWAWMQRSCAPGYAISVIQSSRSAKNGPTSQIHEDINFNRRTRPLTLIFCVACYGITKIPQGSWFCRKCESQERVARVVSFTVCVSIKLY